MAGKAEIVEAISKQTELSKKDATSAFEAFVDSIADSLKKGERVAVPGLGIFSVAERKARTGINPQTKQMMKFPAKKVVKFRVAKAAKDAILAK